MECFDFADKWTSLRLDAAGLKRTLQDPRIWCWPVTSSGTPVQHAPVTFTGNWRRPWGQDRGEWWVLLTGRRELRTFALNLSGAPVTSRKRLVVTNEYHDVGQALMAPLRLWAWHQGQLPPSYDIALRDLHLRPIDGRLGELARRYGPIVIYKHATRPILEAHLQPPGAEEVIVRLDVGRFQEADYDLDTREAQYLDPPPFSDRVWLTIAEDCMGPDTTDAGLPAPTPQPASSGAGFHWKARGR